MMQLYVKAKSKKDLNLRLSLGERIWGTHYTPWGVEDYLLTNVHDGTIIKIFSKYSGRSPIAKSYGTMKGGKVE